MSVTKKKKAQGSEIMIGFKKGLKGALNPNFFNLTKIREKFYL